MNEQAIVAITDHRGVICFVNERFCEVSGYARAELVGDSHRAVSSGRHTREFWHDMWLTICAGGVWHGEICNRARDGSEYWVETTIAPLRRGSRICGFMARGRLILEPSRACERHAQAEHRDADL